MSETTDRYIPNYQQQIDGLRFLCFMGVFSFHCDLDRLWYLNYTLPVYLVLSGFVITKVLLYGEHLPLRQLLRIYYARRILRVFPAYYFVLIFLLMLDKLPFAFWDFFYLFNFKLFWLSWTGNLDALSDWPKSGIHFWSLCIDEQYYLTFPLVFLFVSRTKQIATLLKVLAVCILTRLYFWFYFPSTAYGALTLVGGEYIIWGSLFGLLDTRSMISIKPTYLIWGGFGVCVAIIFYVQPHILRSELIQFNPGLLLTPIAVCISAMVCGIWNDRSSIVYRVLSFKPFVYLGKISYGLYLIHLFTWELYDYLIVKVPSFSVFTPYWGRLLLTFVLANLLWYFVEAPCVRLKGRFAYGAATNWRSSKSSPAII